MTLRLKLLCLAVCVATPALAEPKSHVHDGTPWSVAHMNEVIDQTNFIVGSGRGHCSGTLISLKHRLILTNHHCVQRNIRWITKEIVVKGEVKKKRVEVRSDMTVQQKHYDGIREVGKSAFQAAIVGYVKHNDLALMQIKAKKIPQTIEAAVFADHHGELHRGDEVWTVGNPAGLTATVMRGIVSSTKRVYKSGDGTERSYIQTDAGMFFGNSGGALYDKYGHLVGVPAAIVPGSPIGVAIPYWEIQKLLTANCFEEVWNPDPEMSHKDCMAKRKPKTEKKESVEDLLRKFLEKQK